MTAARHTHAALAPRGLTRAEAAAYLRLSPTTFDDWQRRGIVPGPIAGTKRWDKWAIDAALDRASGLAQHGGTTPYDDWKARQDARPPAGSAQGHGPAR